MQSSLLPLDTTLEAIRVQTVILKRLSPERRAVLSMELSDNLRDVVAAGVRHRHPDYTDEQVRLAVMRLTWGDELFRKVFPDVDVKG